MFGISYWFIGSMFITQTAYICLRDLNDEINISLVYFGYFKYMFLEKQNFKQIDVFASLCKYLVFD
jgi:hypothetical protein